MTQSNKFSNMEHGIQTMNKPTWTRVDKREMTSIWLYQKWTNEKTNRNGTVQNANVWQTKLILIVYCADCCRAYGRNKSSSVRSQSLVGRVFGVEEPEEGSESLECARRRGSDWMRNSHSVQHIYSFIWSGYNQSWKARIVQMQVLLSCRTSVRVHAT